jgi:hypothetical protein
MLIDLYVTHRAACEDIKQQLLTAAEDNGAASAPRVVTDSLAKRIAKDAKLRDAVAHAMVLEIWRDIIVESA